MGPEAATACCLGVDTPDVQCMLEEASRSMCDPKVVEDEHFTRMARYLARPGEAAHALGLRLAPWVPKLVAWTDSDWVGCRKAGKTHIRKSGVRIWPRARDVERRAEEWPGHPPKRS